ncbi:lysine N(6)-hydroxylase/L-ornithine N(5)-oxygenase family protein [Parasphingorhabdus pacifica]
MLAVGAGPSNLALMVALEDSDSGLAEQTLMVEQHADVQWQRGMLIPWAQSQVSFVKDLATARSPRSRFTFLNYLHEQGRLDEFVNLGTFHPYRLDISNYFRWAASNLSRVQTRYNTRCESIDPIFGDNNTITGWSARLGDGSEVTARDVVFGIGRNAHVPEVFRGLPESRLIHSTRYLDRVGELRDNEWHRPVVVGGAQSAAEMFASVREYVPDSHPTIIMRSIGFDYYQTSSFTNELYYSSFVDEFHNAPPQQRERMNAEMRNTNYAGLAPYLLDALYRDQYLQRLVGDEGFRIITTTDITSASFDADEVVLEIYDRKTDRHSEVRCDAVLLGTGFDPQPPELVRSAVEGAGVRDTTVDRNYRVDLGESKRGGVYVQGLNEDTHGISDSLLSVLAQRSTEITSDMVKRRSND